MIGSGIHEGAAEPLLVIRAGLLLCVSREEDEHPKNKDVRVFSFQTTEEVKEAGRCRKASSRTDRFGPQTLGLIMRLEQLCDPKMLCRRKIKRWNTALQYY